MVQESGSTLVVMLGALAERGRTKCQQYWPGPGARMAAHGLTLQTLAELPDAQAACVHRHMLLTVICTDDLILLFLLVS